MPKRTRSHQLEDISRDRLHNLFASAGWTVEDLAKDYGEDLLVRIFENGEATHFSFFVQAKATDNITRYLPKRQDSIRYPVSSKHLAHWNKFQEPIILTLWDSQSGSTYWICIQDALDATEVSDLRLRKKTRISMPLDCKLNAEGISRIRDITLARHKRLERMTEGTNVLIELLEAELGAKVQFSPNGVLISEKQEGESDLLLFGQPAEMLEELAKRRASSLEEAFNFALENSLSEVQKHEKTGMLSVRNMNTGEFELRKMSDEEIKRHARAELNRLDALNPGQVHKLRSREF